VPTLNELVESGICRALDAAPDHRPSSCKEFAHLLNCVKLKRTTGATDSPAAQSAVVHERQAIDRRVSRRYPSALDASCHPLLNGNEMWQAEVEDISQTGVRLQVGRRFEPGAVLAVEVLAGPNDRPASWLVRVRWVREGVSRRWILGCAFSTALSAGELDAYLENRTSTIVLLPGT